MTEIMLRKIIDITAAPSRAIDLVKQALSEEIIQVVDRIPKKWIVTDSADNILIAHLTLEGTTVEDSLSFLLDASFKDEGNISQVEFLYTSEKSNPDMLKDVSSKTHSMLTKKLA